MKKALLIFALSLITFAFMTQAMGKCLDGSHHNCKDSGHGFCQEMCPNLDDSKCAMKQMIDASLTNDLNCMVLERCDKCDKFWKCNGICEQCKERCQVFEYCPQCGLKYKVEQADGRCDKCGKDCFCIEKCDRCGWSHYFNGYCDECASKIDLLRCCMNLQIMDQENAFNYPENIQPCEKQKDEYQSQDHKDTCRCHGAQEINRNDVPTEEDNGAMDSNAETDMQGVPVLIRVVPATQNDDSLTSVGSALEA